MIEGEIQLGVVYEITQQNVYSAVKHCNSCKNGKPIQVSSNTLFQNSLIATGFPISDFETKNNYPNVIIIDTPGFGDTRGIEMDKLITDLISHALKNFVIFT